ncbi:MAG: DNA polymerase III subunit beta [Clostridia bacterium]|nr:DNA polymerase III subunit beta [Clostridia bacterium]
MKFSCDKNTLLEGVMAASKATPSRPTVAILENLLFDADEKLSIIGNNLDTAVSYEIDCNIQIKGSITLNSRIICEIIRKLPDGIVFFELKENNVTHIKCMDVEYDISGVPADDYPDFPTVNGEKFFSIDPEKYMAIIRQTSFAAAQIDMGKPVLMGVKFEIENNLLTASALDGARLAARWVDVEYSGAKIDCVIPCRALNDFGKIIKPEDEVVKVTLSHNFVLFEIGSCRFISRLLEGEFVDFRRFVPTNILFETLINKNEFADSLERAALVIDENAAKSPVKLKFSGNKMTVFCMTQRGKVNDIVDISTSLSEPFEIGFNHRYVLDALRNSECDEILMQFTGDVKPAVIKAPGEEGKFIFIVTPVRLK